jgi:hypothetical protein
VGGALEEELGLAKSKSDGALWGFKGGSLAKIND